MLGLLNQYNDMMLAVSTVIINSLCPMECLEDMYDSKSVLVSFTYLITCNFLITRSFFLTNESAPS